MRFLTLEIERTVDARNPYDRLRGLEAQLDAAKRLIRELEAKLGERPAKETTQ